MKDNSYKKMLETGILSPEAIESLNNLNKIIESFTAWLIEQERRFTLVKNATGPYMLANGKLVPPEVADWFQYCTAVDRDPKQLIMDTDFLEYHNWRVREMKQPEPKQVKEYTVRACGIAIILAYQEGKISQSDFNSKKAIIQLSADTFPKFSGAKVYDAFRQFKWDLSTAESDHPDDFTLATSILSKHF